MRTTNLLIQRMPPHSSYCQFKGTLSSIKDLFKALILIGRSLFCHIKDASEGGTEGKNVSGRLAEILAGKIGRGFAARRALKSAVSGVESLL